MLFLWFIKNLICAYFFVSQYCDQFGLINAGSFARKGD
ncbi:conserved hypothetical protein [Vibrio cholerae O1 str. 2010EL-1786]|uniref:Uncharacterized protein n=3 Tax=Vibrio cholerae TaxID=666 RepID=Q9KTL9_VIBCH|nr:hypothetical protein VC_0883 [Vibrio cholerae O1 biovar El Tor str. N16961]ACP05159.1 conserved hypothetical protein [Vibrio cholerae M66-2]ACP08913.1 conserved hypothetical protein [Vibrio cholerae O395]AET25999.1 conserved hypothetical protein [Vibrio cholerae O1 str. 2010EL-1786]EET22137.1 conserved hypothetical protein [Vibrio cholerae MO10]CSI45492.1 Uncharacterised protein [Vibrio cholerae]